MGDSPRVATGRSSCPNLEWHTQLLPKERRLRWTLLALAPLFVLMGICSVSVNEAVEVCSGRRDHPPYAHIDVVERSVIPPRTTCDFVQEDGDVIRRRYTDTMAGFFVIFGALGLACLFGYVWMSRKKSRRPSVREDPA